MKNIFIAACLVLGLSCASRDAGLKAKPEDELLEIDSKFAKACEDDGYYNALSAFYDSSNIVRLEPFSQPIVGGSVMGDLESRKDDYKNFTFKFSADNAKVSNDGTMGFVYGICTVKDKTNLTESKGTYINIWQKNKDGQWHIVFDAGNSGIKPDDANKTTTTEKTNDLGEFNSEEELNQYMKNKLKQDNSLNDIDD